MTIAEANEPFASGVRAILAEKGLKNIHVAEKARYTSQELSDMLCGRRLIKACDIPKLAGALEVGVGDIYSVGAKKRVH